MMAKDAVADFAALDLSAVALLLDIDGTIIDLGPHPFEVHVPDMLLRSLDALLKRTSGALALVSGRPIRDIDTLFAPLRLPAIGGHGAELRPRHEVIAGAMPLPEPLRAMLRQAESDGVVIEDKGYSFALHFRQAPQLEPRVRALVEKARAEFADDAIEVLPGKAMFEVKRSGVSKGEAVRKLMRETPFKDRAPVFIGDDVTDESVFAVLPVLKGTGYSVGRRFDGVAGVFAAPSEVRETLSRLALI